MKDQIEQQFTELRTMLVEQIARAGVSHPSVLAALNAVPRHQFVVPILQDQAYQDIPLPIGHEQTISQPFMVARMTELLMNGYNKLKKVLEIGTGSGYQTAVLAKLVDEIYTIECIPELAAMAKIHFKQLKLTHVYSQCADGKQGWPTHAPYDGIIVTAAPKEIPAPLLDQLADGGRMVIPLGQAGQQYLQLITREGKQFRKETVDLVSFVPLI